MNGRVRIEELQRVLAAAQTLAESRVAALVRAEAAVAASLAAHAMALRKRAAEARVTDPALRAGADLGWQAWVEGQRRLLLAEQARLRARLIEARGDLARAHGRKLAGEELQRSFARDLAARQARRAEDQRS